MKKLYSSQTIALCLAGMMVSGYSIAGDNSLTICNKSSTHSVSIAMGRMSAGEALMGALPAHVDGWWRVKPNGCTELLSGAGYGTTFWFRMQTEGRVIPAWDEYPLVASKQELCIDTDDGFGRRAQTMAELRVCTPREVLASFPMQILFDRQSALNLTLHVDPDRILASLPKDKPLKSAAIRLSNQNVRLYKWTLDTPSEHKAYELLDAVEKRKDQRLLDCQYETGPDKGYEYSFWYQTPPKEIAEINSVSQQSIRVADLGFKALTRCPPTELEARRQRDANQAKWANPP